MNSNLLEQPLFYIYKLTFKSGATYIGQHLQRQKVDSYVTSSAYYRHHTQDDPLLKREILIYVKDRETMDIMETICIIEDKQTSKHNANYNLGGMISKFFGGWNKGQKISEEARRKLSASRKGRTPWNKGKVGLQKAWNRGKKATPEQIEKK